MSTLVSILVPAYNASSSISAALSSAFAQTWPNVEVIVVDDNSSDDTLSRAQTFAAQHSGRELRIISQPKAGAASARNHALRFARGDFIQFLDADDLLAPDKIALQLDALRSAQPLALASGTWGRFQSQPDETRWSNEAVAKARSGVEFLQLHYETGSMMQTSAWLAPRALLDLSGPWDESLSLNDDGEYFARVMLRSSAIVPVPTARCHYRTGIGPSLSRRRDPCALVSLHRSIALTTAHLIAADSSVRSCAAAGRAWRTLAFELYPDAPSLACSARAAAVGLGEPSTPLGGPAWVGHLARFIGWSLARRLHVLRDRLL
jgi:glycosyltransferase involved in cell wall biosynthesis